MLTLKNKDYEETMAKLQRQLDILKNNDGKNQGRTAKLEQQFMMLNDKFDKLSISIISNKNTHMVATHVGSSV